MSVLLAQRVQLVQLAHRAMSVLLAQRAQLVQRVLQVRREQLAL